MIQIQNGGMLQIVGLIDDGLHHVGVAVAAAHGGYAAEAVQVSPPLFIEQVLHLPMDYVHLLKPFSLFTNK